MPLNVATTTDVVEDMFARAGVEHVSRNLSQETRLHEVRSIGEQSLSGRPKVGLEVVKEYHIATRYQVWDDCTSQAKHQRASVHHAALCE